MEPNRRQFLTAATVATALSQSRILGANDRVCVAGIGTGHRCEYLLETVNKVGGADIVALCDVYEPYLDFAKHKTAPNAHTYTDYRQVLDRTDVDAVVIGAPNHWHVHMLLDAVAARKDVYVEKPLTHTIAQGEALTLALKGTKQVVQVGLQQRSWPHFRQAKELIAGGGLGRITLVETYWYQSYTPSVRPPEKIDTSKLDWKQWLGSAPQQPFDAERFRLWRWYWDFGGGAMTDLFCHWVDVAHWCMDHDTPETAIASGDRYIRPEFECPDTISAYLAYPGNFTITYLGTLNSNVGDGGLIFHGSDAVLRIDRSGFEVQVDKRRRPGPNQAEAQTVKSERDGTIDHMHNFLECVRSRKTPNAPPEVGVTSARASHLGNLALRDGRLARMSEVLATGLA